MGEGVAFPAAPFRNVADIEEYVSGDRIICLVCGKGMKALNSHIQRVHDIGAEEYRERFNVPKKYPLCSAETAARHSEVAQRPENLGRIAALGREYGPITHGSGTAHELLLSRPKEWDFSWHLREAANNPLYLTVTPPEGQASWHTFWKARFENLNLQRQWEDARSQWDHQANYQPRREQGRFCSVVAERAQRRLTASK